MLRRLALFTLLLPGALFAAAEGADTAQPTAKLSQPIGVGEILQVFLALVFVLVLIGVAAWLLRRFSVAGFNRQGALRMLASVSVGQRERIVLVQAGETQMLLGVAQGSVRTLHVFDKPIVLEGREVDGGERFAERLASALQRKGGGEK